jgi:glycerate kinase
VALLETSLQRWALVVADAVGQDFSARAGAGAAGGVGFAAMALLGATAQPGIELMLSMLGFSELLPGACLVVTGEGSLDEQSLHGKAPVGVAQAAARLGIATVAVAGRTTLSPGTLAAAGFSATHTLQGIEPDLTRCMAEPAPLVVRIGRQIATESLLPMSPTSR